MGRGFLSGVFWGAVVGVALLFVSSQALVRQQMSLPQPQAGTVEVPGGSEFDQARAETDPVLPVLESAPEAEPAQGIPLPAEEADTPPALDTSALEVPVPSTVEAAPGLGTAPDAEGGSAPVAPGGESAVSPAASAPLVEPETPAAAPEAASVPEAPEAAVEPEPTPEAVPSAEPAPAADTGIAALPEADTETRQPETGSAPEQSLVSEAPAEPAAPEVTEETSLPGVSSAPEQPPLPEVVAAAEDPVPEAPLPDAAAPEVAAAPEIEDAPEAATAPVAEEAPAAAETPNVAEAPAPDATEAAAEDAPVAELAEAAPELERGGAASIRLDDGPSLLQPVETLPGDASSGSGRLPGVLRVGEEVAPEAAPDAAETEEAAEEPSDLPALQAYGTPFENPEGRPLVAIVLVHTGEGMLDLARLASLPPNVAFAIDAARADATEVARGFRAAGREVVMIPTLPGNARPQDIEQALQANFDRVPEAVALMDVSGDSFQTDRAAVSQVVAVAGATGHGLITFPRGLNPAHQEAERQGVPAGLVFRDLDAAGEDQDQIARALDRAAFRARQDDAAILVGTTADQTLAAVIEWSLGSRAQGVAIAPISAALLGG